MTWGLVYGALTLLTLAAAWRRSEDARAAALILAFTWVVTNVAHEAFRVHYNAYFAAMDATLAVSLSWVWRNRLSAWRAVLIALFLCQIAAHAHFFRTWAGSRDALWCYDATLNALYAGQLACVVWGRWRTS